MQHFLKKLNQRGFTLIEIAIVLTIVGLVIGGIWLAASTVLNNNRIAEASRQVLQIVQNTKNLFTTQTGNAPAAGFTHVAGIAAGVFPAGSVITQGAAQITKHPFSTGNVNSITMAGVGNQVTLNYGVGAPPAATALSQDACIAIATTVATPANFQRYGIITVNGLNAAAAANVNAIIASCPVGNTDVNIVFTVP